MDSIQIKSLFVLTFLMLFCLFVRSNLFATTIYVDSTLSSNCTAGNYSISNRNCSGSDGDAYTTVLSAINAMNAGDTVYIRGGTYNEIQIDLSSKNDGTSNNPYIISSYPGEWAVIDGQHAGSGTDQSIFYSSTGLSYWTFERLEITGGGTTSADLGAGIHIEAHHCTFKYLYVHDNYASTHNWGAAGGLMLTGGSQYNIIEYCWFKDNGNVQGDVNTGNANIAIYSDYKYGDTVDINTATIKNEIRYNLIETGGNGSNWTPTGIMHKGFQRLTGYNHGETENPADNPPNGSTYRAYGDKIHHNVIIGSAQGIRADQDYVQIYNNIIDINLNGVSTEGFAAIRTRDAFADRRGSFWPCVYNNTILADGGQALTLAVIKDGWDCSTDGTRCDYSFGFAPNNIIVSADDGYDWNALSVNSGSSSNCSGAQPHSFADFELSRNFFYQPESSTKLVYFEQTDYSESEIESTAAADTVWTKTTPSPFLGTTGADKYKTNGTYQLDTTYTISNGGIDSSHPYLTVESIPSYVGATNPNDNAWVDGVLNDVSSTAWLQAQGDNDPSWVEGNAHRFFSGTTISGATIK